MSNIRVALRVRPLNEKEKDEGSKEIVKVNKNSVRIENDKVLGIPEFGDSRSRIREFIFDHIYDCMRGENALSSQVKVFEDLGTDVLKAAFDGFNACVFAYGQTGTGKTHTMMGYPGDVGLIPRICEGLFTHMSECSDENLTHRIDVSYFEIYNERVRDLLQPEMIKLNENYSLKVREHPKDGPYVKDLSWHRVKTNEDIQTLLDKGNKYRVTAETYMHGHSSRSHAIVTVSYTQARLEENRPSEIVSKINLVDLAGSERADPSSKPDFRKRLTEGANINKSLVTLGYVIKALAEKSLLSWSIGDMGSTQSFHSSSGGETGASMSPAGPNKQRVPYIPYRDSVLTWLLRDSLGGNSKTIMIATITPASQYYSESISTLRYAQRAKNIINKPRINEDTNVALIRELRQEIDRLHRMLATAQMPASQLGPSYLPGDIVYFVPDLHRGQDELDNESGSMVTLQESEDAIIAEKLHENEEMAKQLTQSWMCKWSSTHDIMKESDLSIRGLHNQSSSMGVMIDSQLPYLIGMDDDVLSTGIVIFHLKEGDTLIGREDAENAQDIVLHGPTIQKEHCVIKHVNGEVYLHPCPGSLCAVQDLECTEPTKLSQGDYVILGGNQHFRFNNPSEAAKLRENRRSQGSLNVLNSSHLSFGGLSRASSYSSIGGDDQNYLSPPQLGRSYPNGRRRHSDAVIYAAPDLCRDLERRYQTEQERIAEASKELERLKAEHERAEELRQLKEEEMYMTHEQHRADIEEQKRHLLRLKEENERERAKAEEELRLARESLAKEKDAFQKKLEEERKALKALKKIEEQQESMAIQTDPLSYSSTSVGPDPLSTQTMSVGSDPLSTQSVSVGSENASTTATSTGAEDADILTDLPVRYKGGRRVSANDQLDDLAQTEFTRRMSYRETEESLAIQQEDIEDAYLQTEAQLEDKLRKIQKMEKEYKEVDKAHLQEMEAQTEKLQEIRKQEVQLEVYIQESEELSNVRKEKPQPLRTACSEMFLLDPSIQEQQFSQKTTSLLDIQGADGEEQLSPRSRQIRRSSSADSLESGISEVSKDLSMDAERLKAQKDKKISSVAKQVTSRLYQAPEPKFKYVPKTKEKEIKTIPRTKVVRDRTADLMPRTSIDRTARVTKSESPQRVTGKRTSPAPSRNTDIKKRPGSAIQRDQKSKQGPKLKNAKDGKNKGENQDKPDKNTLKVKANENKIQGLNRANSPSSRLGVAISPPTRQNDVASPPTRESDSSSPTSRLGGAVSSERLGISGSNVARTSPLRQMVSATSLASVPESLAEYEDSDMGESQNEQNKVTTYVVKKRQKKGRANFIDDDFRCHSAPDSQRMSQALDDYTEEMNLELQPGVSNSNRSTPYLMTSLSVDDSMVNTEVDMKTNDIVTTEVENEPNEIDAETKADESDVDHVHNHSDSDVEMQETVKMDGKSVNIYISSDEESRCLDSMEMSQESNTGTDMADQNLSENLCKSNDYSTEMDLCENSILQNKFMETSETNVSENTENVVLGKRERVDNDKCKETEVPTKKSRSVPDIMDNLSCTESNEGKTRVSTGTDSENFSEDSLDLNISIDSLEGEKQSDRLTQSLPAYIIRTEKPMSEDSLSDSCNEHDDMERDLQERNKNEHLSDVTPTNNENTVLLENLHASSSSDVQSNLSNDNATELTTMDIENMDDQYVNENSTNTASVNKNKGNKNYKDHFSQDNANELNLINLATDAAKFQNDCKKESDQLPSEVFKVENYISDVIKHAQEIACESVKNDSCINLSEETKIHKLSNNDIRNENGPELVYDEDRTNETIVFGNKPEYIKAYNDDINNASAKSDDFHKDIEVNQEFEINSMSEPNEELSCHSLNNPIKDDADHEEDHDIVTVLPKLGILESIDIVLVTNEDSDLSKQDNEDSSSVNDGPVYFERTENSDDENIDNSDIMESRYKALESDNESKISDNSNESNSTHTDSFGNVFDNLKGVTGATSSIGKSEPSSDTDHQGKKKGACVDENQNVVSMADGMVEYNRNLVDADQEINTQNEEDLNMNLGRDSNGQENMEAEDDSVTLMIEKESNSLSEPAVSNLHLNTEENEGESSAQPGSDKNEDNIISAKNDTDFEKSEGHTELFNTKSINELNNDSKGTAKEPENHEISDVRRASDLELTSAEETQQKDKPDIVNHSSPLVKTRSIGVGTSQDLIDGPNVAKTEDNMNQGSEDSFEVDPREKLQELQEVLGRLPGPARSGPQLSTARRATRQRAMIRQQHRGGDSDGVAQLSDEALISGTQTKNSNRPSSGSRRRKRPSNKSIDKTNKLFRDQSSDDYDSSENDSVYSDDSVDAFKPLKHQNGDAHNESDITCDSTDVLNFAGRSDTANMPSGSKNKHKRTLSPSLLRQQSDVTDIIDGPDGKRTVGIQTFGHSQRNRSTSSTRTDYSDYNGSFTSEGRGMVMSPLSLWNSNERSDRESHSDSYSTSSAGYIKNLNDLGRDMTQTSRLSTRSNVSLFSERSNLEQGQTEVWSSSSSELRPLADFRDDLSYTFETEAMHPATSSMDYTDDSKSHHSSIYVRTPREGERLIPRPDCSTPTNTGRVVNISFPESQLHQAANLDSETPVKFEVTVNENNTNIEYNVEKTEYKTYMLRNQNEPNIIPDRILVSMTENLNSQTEENYASQHREEITMHKPNGINSEDSLVLGKSYRTSTSSEKETEITDGEVKREESKESKKESKEDSYYHLPSNPVSNKKNKNLQTSVIENIDYPRNSQGEDGVCAPNISKEFGGASLNESDYTSDYGTFISVDGRYGYLTVSSDSEESESDPTSKNQSEALEMLVQNEIIDTDASSMVNPEVSLNLCTSSEQSSNPNIAGTQINCTYAPQVSRRSGPIECKSEESQPEVYSAENKLNNFDILHEDGPTTDLGYESMRPESSDEHKEGNQNEDNVETETSSVDTIRPAGVGENDFTSQETLVNLTGSNENVDTKESSKHIDAKVPKLDFSQSQISSPQRQQRLSISSADEPYLSLDQSESNTSTCSSDYKTPMQSPRENIELEANSETVPKEVDDVIIPDYYDEKQSTPRQSLRDFSEDQAPILTSSPKQSNNVRTASVNTESVPTVLQSVSPAISTVKLFGNSKDPVHTEAFRKNLEQKIARLTRHVRSLSDSAISSDFTDGDSSSVSPRGSRVYDDKSFHGEKKLLQVLRPTLSPTRVRATLNFEGPHPTKLPFKDSGNVYDDDTFSKVDGPKRHRLFETSFSQEHYLPLATPVGTFPENLIDSLLAIKPQQLQRSLSLDSLSTIINLNPHLARAVRQVQSIENIPGTISPSDNTVNDSPWKGNYASLSSDGTRSLSPGEIVMDQDIDDIYDMENIIQIDASQNRKICEKSTSMSVLEDNTRQREYHRSLSEGNIDDFDDEADNSNTSNDSITFVFIKDDRNKPSDSEQDKGEPSEVTSVSDPCESRRKLDSEDEQDDSMQFLVPIEYADEIANISGRGPLVSKSEDKISDVLSFSGSEDSVIEYNQRMGDAEEDKVSTHSASEEIEEIIESGENQEQMGGIRDMDIIIQTDSPPTYTDTSESFVQGRGKYYEEDSEPLRHKFGIDESVLPIPERSVSADNIPKRLKPPGDLMRSRSTGMLDVGIMDEPESESGIFPPARADTDQTEPSISMNTMSEGGLDHISQRTFSDIDASLSNRTSGDVDSENCNSGENSSAIVRSICSRSSSVSSLEEEFIIDYKTNWGKHKHKHIQGKNHSGDSEDEDEFVDEEQQIRRVLETVQRLICPKPRSVDRGMTTENEEGSNSVSIGIQTSSSETNPETSSNLQSFVNADQIILPALAAPFRAQSMDSFGLGAIGQGLELSEGSRNWCTLGELMVETTHLLRRINDRLPEQTRKGSVSSSEESQASQVILKKWQEISIQTGRSLEDLTTVSTQTDDDYILNGTEKVTERKDSELSKQSMKKLDLAGTITHDIVLVTLDSNLCEMSVQTDESFDEFSVIERRENSLYTDVSHNGYSQIDTKNQENNNNHLNDDMQSQQSVVTSLYENSIETGNSNTDGLFAQSVAPISFSQKEQQLSNDEEVEKMEVGQQRTAKYIPQIKAELGLDDVKSTEMSSAGTKAVSTMRQDIVKPPNLPGFTLPDMPEITELRREHARLMENLRKASDERRNRKETLQARKKPLSPDESSKLNSLSDTNDNVQEDSNDKLKTKSHYKVFIVNKNDPETESSSSNSSFVENNVRSDGEDRENIIPKKTEVEDVIRSDGEDKVPSSEEVDEDVVRSDGDDQESVDNVRSDVDDKESLENVRSDDEEKLVAKNDKCLDSVTSPLSTQEFVQINIQVDPSSGVTVKNKTIREPSPKRRIESSEKNKKGNIKEEHKWEITGDEFRTVWERKTESRSRSESNSSEDTVSNTLIIEEFPADPAVVAAMKLEDFYNMNKSDEALTREMIDDVLELSPISKINKSRSDRISDKIESTEEDSISDGRDSPASIVEDIVQPETYLRDQHVPSTFENTTLQNRKRDKTDKSSSGDKQHTTPENKKDSTEGDLESDGRESPASVVEDIVQPETCIRDQHVPSIFEKMTMQNGQRDKTENSNAGAKQHTTPQEPIFSEETIIPQVYKRHHSLQPSLKSNFGELLPEMIHEPEVDSRDRKKEPQQIFKSETSPKYEDKLLRDQQRQGASPDFMEFVEILPENMFPHQHSTYPLPENITRSKKNKGPALKNDCKPASKPPQFSDDSTQMSLTFSDDFTQTDPDLPNGNTPSLDYVDQVCPKYESPTHSQPNIESHEQGNVQTKPKEAKTSEEFREEFVSLQQERQHIMDLLGLSYLPNSLTVELLEAKLNYCIGQTDLLLDSLEDTTEAETIKKKIILDQKQTKDFISKYRADLKKSKNDIKECREHLNNGRGRGRPATRGRQRTRRGDIVNLQRQAEIDAFKLERLREQQDYARASKHGSSFRGNTPLKGNTPLYGNSPVVTPRSEHSRSSSPNYSPGYMNPREHKAHLVDLRRQLIKDVVEEEIQHSRSCSPSFHTSPPPLHLHTSPPPMHKHRHTSEHSLGFSPKVSVSLSDVPGSQASSPLSPGGSKTYIVAPGTSSLSPVGRTSSFESANPYGSYQSSPDRANRRRRISPSSLDREMTAQSIFSPQESEQILKEIEEFKKRTQVSSPIEELLRRSSYSSSSSQRSSLSRPDVPVLSPRSHSDPRLPRRTSTSPVSRQLDNPLSLNLDCLRDEETGPYSPYSAYAREHIIPNERSPTGGVLRGTYELYHDRSDTSSVLSYDSDTFVDQGHRSRHNTLDEDTIKRLRPIRAEDIKARINRHKR